MAMPVTACNSQTTTSAVETLQPAVQKAKQNCLILVNRIISAYLSGFPGELEKLVSDDYISNKQEFINHIELSAPNQMAVNISPIIDRMQFKGTDKLIVKFSWNRTYTSQKSGSHQKDSRETTFVFVKEESRWLLLKISGSDIFSYK